MDKARQLTGLHATPEFLFRGNQQGDVARIERHFNFHPFAAAGDDRQHRGPQMRHPHVVLQLRRVFCRPRLFRKRPRQHEPEFKHGLSAVDDPVQGGRHPRDRGMANMVLDLPDAMAGVALVPLSVERFGGQAKLDEQVIGEIDGLGFAALFPPQPLQRGLILTHDDPRVRTSDKGPPVWLSVCPQPLASCPFLLSIASRYIE